MAAISKAPVSGINTIWLLNPVLLSSRILKDQFTSPFPCPQTRSPRKLPRISHSGNSQYDHVKSINLVTATMHEDTVKNVLLTDVRYYLMIYVSK